MLPRLLILDDLFGRNMPKGRNPDRENLCAHFLWRDGTIDAAARTSRQKVIKPTAEAVFYRAQVPACSDVGDTVENSVQASLEAVRSGWPDESTISSQHSEVQQSRWAMLLLDLCFYTGNVTEESHQRTPGMPEGRPGDDDPSSYFGLTLLDAIHREFPELPAFILSSKPREEVSLEFSQRGALGFIGRADVRGPKLLEEALWQHGLLGDPSGEMAGTSLPVLLALREARRAARHRQNVLIRGERGSGKELLATYLHRMNKPKEGHEKYPFVAVNSAAFTQNLFASELFGIEPKTATNVDGKIGLIEAANGGDLFLDEIADMPAEVQAAVLRVLQERQIVRVGGRQPKEVDVRFISATNAEIELEQPGFRPDLLDRLRLGGSLWLPPLRERKSDIPLLAEKFVRDAEQERFGSMRRDLTAEALDKLLNYDWPGNIRELRSCVFDAVNRHPDVEHLVAGHLRIGTDGSHRRRDRSSKDSPSETAAKATTGSGLLGELLARINSCDFPPNQVEAWVGHLTEVQHAQARFLARYLQAALHATKRRTPEAPQGQIQIHPAVKLITGDSSLTASKAADVVKRLLSPLEGELEGDLREAYEIAVRLRPKSVAVTSQRTPKPAS
jgi:DNA-binding NtrC family response regulator